MRKNNAVDKDDFEWLERKVGNHDKELIELRELIYRLKTRLDFVQDSLELYQPYKER